MSSSSSSSAAGGGVSLREAVQALERLAPSSLAESWDNVGLLVEPWPMHRGERPVRRALLTNDLTPAVYEEAAGVGADLLVSYHPPLFRPIRRLACSDWKQALVSRALADGVAVYSPHTAWDAMPDGVNDWLLQAFAGVADLASSRPVTPRADDAGAGAGRWAPLLRPLPVAEAVGLVKRHLGLSSLHVAEGGPAAVRGVGACAGSGASVLLGADQCDLLLTGEMSHHELLDCACRQRTVLLTHHTNCERGFLRHVLPRLRTLLPGVQFSVSGVDADPLVTQ